MQKLNETHQEIFEEALLRPPMEAKWAKWASALYRDVFFCLKSALYPFQQSIYLRHVIEAEKTSYKTMAGIRTMDF